MLQFLTGYIRQARAMIAVTLLFSVPASVLLYYMSLHVETSLLERRIRQLRREQEVLLKKNDALRREIRRTVNGGSEPLERLPAADRIVHIRLGQPAKREGERR